ncbi:hypothetical protein ABES02_28435 [Neobacillus pocheonensis]|uniref:hypothetical protein n=1 Tax=Neobacillus pocheonensis TaxID=363869 RepID=UPI003D2D0935
MLDIVDVKEGSRIKYISDDGVFDEPSYKVISAESTYKSPNECPENEKGKLMIIEFMNDGTPMFFTIDSLNPKDWAIVS